ncbi:MAG: hypothetical protein JWP87_4342 [Labilithrix sp.]|nr:hypothetical protein [Labilithrix sp.]
MRGLSVLLVLCASGVGCSAILGFHDGALAQGREGEPCNVEGTHTGCADGLTCRGDRCVAQTACDGGCTDGGNGDAGGDPAVIATLDGTPGDVLSLNGFVYFTHTGGVYGCAADKPCPMPAVMYAQSVNPSPQVLAPYGSLVTWADPVAGKLSYCYFGQLVRCSSATTFTEPGVSAVTTDTSTGRLYWVNRNAGAKQSDLRALATDGTNQTSTIVTLPAAGTGVSLASDGPQRKLVQIGRSAFSIFTPTGSDAGPSVVHELVKEDPLLAEPAKAAIMVSARRVIWTRASDRGGGLAQCEILEGETTCEPTSVTTFAAAGMDVTAAAATSDRVVWAQRGGSGTEVWTCAPTPGDFSERACVPERLAGELGRVSALTIEPSVQGPDVVARYAYFVMSELKTPSFVVERVRLP